MVETTQAAEEALCSQTLLLRSSQMNRSVAAMIVLRSLRCAPETEEEIVGHHSCSTSAPEGVKRCRCSSNRVWYQTSRENEHPRSMQQCHHQINLNFCVCFLSMNCHNHTLPLSMKTQFFCVFSMLLSCVCVFSLVHELKS